MVIYSYKCKTCECQHKKTLYISNKNKILDQHKTYYEANKDKMLESGKEYRKLNKDEIKDQQQKYYVTNKDKILENRKEYQKLNKDKLNEYKKQYLQNRRNTNPVYRLIGNNRARIYKALNVNNKATNTIELLQCNRQFFYEWIQF